MKKNNFKTRWFLCIAVSLILLAAMPVFADEYGQTGNLLSYRLAEIYAQPEVNWVFDDPMVKEVILKTGITFPPAQSQVSVYRLIYNTENTGGAIVKASGIVCLPKFPNQVYPLLSYQHGTVFNKYGAPFYIYSCPDARFIAAVFAGQGYVVAMPDYIGQGESKVYHPYLNADTEASASLDMIRAAKQFCAKRGVKLNGKLFLAGYSQGAHATAALQRLIEKKYAQEFPITASALLAGPYDLNGLWINLEKNKDSASSAIMARIAVAYNRIYGLGPYYEIFKSPYDVNVPPLFDERHHENVILRYIPKGARNLFRGDFLKRTAGRDNKFSKELKKNSLCDWAPKCPTRLYISPADELVPYGMTEATYNNMKKLGGNVQMLEILGGFSHNEAIVPAVYDAKRWFDSF